MTAISNQAMLATITSTLVALLMNDQQQRWGIGDEKPLEKQEKRFYDDITKAQQNDKKMRRDHGICFTIVASPR